MVIVESKEVAEKVLNELKNKELLVIPILSDRNLHPMKNSLAVLGVSTRTESYFFTIEHVDASELDINILREWKSTKPVWTLDKKLLSHLLPWNLLDVNSIEYLSSGVVTDYKEFQSNSYKQFCHMFENLRTPKCSKLNSIAPLMKHIEFLENGFIHAWSVIDTFKESQAYTFLNDIAIPALGFVERSGIYAESQLEFTEYNLYTTTGRCSNKFGGINYAAINKKDGSRKRYISRFERGMIVSSDYESFHLRLIADMIGWEFPAELPVHEYLGRQYFNKTEALTPEEYEESKLLTFKLLYSERRDKNVPEFFTAVYDYVDMLMVLLDRNGYILSPYYKREIKKDKIDSPTPQKVFSYMIQLAETELNLTTINKLQPLFKNKQSKPVLYTYDSLLFDFCLDDGKDLLIEAIKILSHDGKFPMRVFYGQNYHDLKKLTL
jgi:hypothetical protein